jgi:hypothetical protein
MGLRNTVRAFSLGGGGGGVPWDGRCAIRNQSSRLLTEVVPAHLALQQCRNLARNSVSAFELRPRLVGSDSLVCCSWRTDSCNRLTLPETRGDPKRPFGTDVNCS